MIAFYEFCMKNKRFTRLEMFTWIRVVANGGAVKKRRAGKIRSRAALRQLGEISDQIELLQLEGYPTEGSGPAVSRQPAMNDGTSRQRKYNTPLAICSSSRNRVECRVVQVNGALIQRIRLMP